jgi:hypothetical protein
MGMSSTHSNVTEPLRLMSEHEIHDSILSLRESVYELKRINNELERRNRDLRLELAKYECRFPNVEWFKLKSSVG